MLNLPEGSWRLVANAETWDANGYGTPCAHAVSFTAIQWEGKLVAKWTLPVAAQVNANGAIVHLCVNCVAERLEELHGIIETRLKAERGE